MNYLFRNNTLRTRALSGFTIVEAMAAVTILGIIASSVLMVITNCSVSTIDARLKMQAFETARENMEELLTKKIISPQSDLGYSEKYSDIQWSTTVETFYEPVNKDMWVRAICTAEYEDSNGETKEVELTHWLTKLNENEIKSMNSAIEKAKELAKKLMDQGIKKPENKDIESSGKPDRESETEFDFDSLPPEFRDLPKKLFDK